MQVVFVYFVIVQFVKKGAHDLYDCCWKQKIEMPRVNLIQKYFYASSSCWMSCESSGSSISLLSINLLSKLITALTNILTPLHATITKLICVT